MKKNQTKFCFQIGERATQFGENYEDNPSYSAKGQCAICLVRIGHLAHIHCVVK